MLDRQVIAARASGKETASLLDQRQMQIDALSPIIALREVVRPDGAAMIVAADGTVLLDGSAVRLSFSPTATMSPDRTAPLPAVLLDGRSVPTGPDGPLSGGTLAAAIRLRDTLTPALQSGLDKLALEIASRLRSADTTLPTGAAGLLTDEGGAVADPARLAGLSARLERNAAVDTNSGGALWRVRSGLGATTPLPPGDSRLLNGLSAALSAPTLGVEALLGPLAQSRTRAEEQASFATARSSTLSQQMAQGGVNSDRELQDLMQIERAYAANARVLQAVDEMLEFLLAR
jgi:flagellar hook-associated protein 1 FlgK